jgi:hypothetical protein
MGIILARGNRRPPPTPSQMVQSLDSKELEPGLDLQSAHSRYFRFKVFHRLGLAAMPQNRAKVDLPLLLLYRMGVGFLPRGCCCGAMG